MRDIALPFILRYAQSMDLIGGLCIEKHMAWWLKHYTHPTGGQVTRKLRHHRPHLNHCNIYQYNFATIASSSFKDTME